jgi:hypothetical protein
MGLYKPLKKHVKEDNLDCLAQREKGYLNTDVKYTKGTPWSFLEL